jgi:hypothetical protein
MHGTTAGDTGRGFTGSRQPVHPMPIPLRKMVRTWCHLNGIFMSEDGQYITWNDGENGKDKLIRLYLNYHKNIKGQEFVIASNNRIQRSVNITGFMAVEKQIQDLKFSKDIMDMFNANLLNDED